VSTVQTSSDGRAADLPVVMVHGWGGSFRTTWQQPGWEALLGDIGRRVVGVDLLGHGSNAKPHEVEAYHDLTTAITDAVPEGRFDAVGFSLGSLTLLELACRVPERIGRLVVSGIGTNVFDDTPRDDLADAVVRGAHPESTAIERQFAGYARDDGNDPVALAACLRAARPKLTAERLAAVTCPTLVALGDRDFVWPADELVAALPDARLVVLPGCDHFATPENFRFIDAVLDFLA
jgi:pimeloyl-ACP methyl ester carboxylesterase